MTTIAYKNGVLAADSRVTDKGDIIASMEKVIRLPSGALYAEAGDDDDRDLVRLLAKVRTFNQLPSRRKLLNLQLDCLALLVLPNGELYRIQIDRPDGKETLDWEAAITPVPSGVSAVGTGKEYALGAMAAGKSAVQAVAIACKFDSRSGLPVRSMPLVESKN